MDERAERRTVPRLGIGREGAVDSVEASDKLWYIRNYVSIIFM